MCSSECWYSEVCSEYKEGCEKLCTRYAEMKFLMDNSNIPKNKQRPLSLYPSECDLEAFKRLAEIKDNIVDFVEDGKNLYICSSVVGNGKAQPLDAKILSVDGFISMRDIEVGDKIYGEDGILHTVIGKFNRGEREVYRVYFKDGVSTLCCDEHLWVVFDRKSRKFVTLELNQILENGLLYNNKFRYTIPVCKPLQFSKKELSLHPYVMGALIGDGSIGGSGITFTNSEKDIVDRVIRYLPDGCMLKVISSTRDNEFGVFDNNCGFIQGSNSVRNRVKESFRQYGLMNKHSYEKFIPNDYLWSSIEDRIWLLRGLIDTDGYINLNSNTIEYSTTSKQLAEDFKFLVQSLGGTVNIKQKIKKYTYKGEQKIGRTAYSCWCKFPSDLVPFSSEKHTKRYAFHQQFEPQRTICNIEYVGKLECACIKTDNPSELYLTNDCIVTHNTTWSLKLLMKYFDEIWDGNGFVPRGVIVHIPTFLIKCKDFKTEDSEFEELKKLLLDVDLVVWDDIAGVTMSNYDYSQLLVYLDAREFKGLSNIFTSNITNRDTLINALGSKITSRVWNSNTEVIEFKGGERR